VIWYLTKLSKTSISVLTALDMYLTQTGPICRTKDAETFPTGAATSGFETIKKGK
jgi:hypothetical protein